MNTCENSNNIYYVSYLIGIFINMFIINALNNIEKNVDCECFKSDKRQLLKEWFTFLIFMNTLFLVFFIFSNYECYDIFYKENINGIFLLLIVIIQIIMLVRLFVYIRYLKNECKCSYGNEEKIIYWYLYILFIIFLTIFILSILSILLLINKMNF